MIEKNKILEACLSTQKGEKYDVAICYSGGKDSAFLIYLLKEIYGLRVIAVSVDNGFEFESTLEGLEEFPNNVGIPLKVIKPDRDFFKKLYHNLIVSPGELQDGKRNHVCHVCNNMIWCQVMIYAADNNIPFVASGLGLEQLNSGRSYPLEINRMANRIAEKSTRKILRMVIEHIHSDNELMKDAIFCEEVSRLESISNQVVTVYPYIYHKININEQKKLIREYGQWRPLNDEDFNKYISSGCLIMKKVMGELEKLELIRLNEREEAKRMSAAGQISEEQIAFAYRDVTRNKVNLSDAIFDELDVKNYLMEIAIKRKQL